MLVDALAGLLAAPVSEQTIASQLSSIGERRVDVVEFCQIAEALGHSPPRLLEAFAESERPLTLDPRAADIGGSAGRGVRRGHADNLESQGAML